VPNYNSSAPLLWEGETGHPFGCDSHIHRGTVHVAGEFLREFWVTSSAAAGESGKKKVF